MKVFVSGATGFVGRHVTTQLLRNGNSVNCLVRDPDSAAASRLKELGAGVVAGDVTDAESLTTAVSETDAFVHLVGIIYESPGATFEQVHLQGTLNALAAANASGASRFVYMSALGAGPNAISGYLKSKWDCEEAVRQGRIPHTIFRPSIIYGTGGEFIHMLISQVKIMPLVPIVGNGRYRMQPVTAADVAGAVASSLNRPVAAGKTYELGGPDTLMYSEMVDILVQVMNKWRLKLYIPVSLMWLVAFLSEKTQRKPLVTRDQLKMLVVDNVCDIGPAREELGFSPVNFFQGISELLN